MNMALSVAKSLAYAVRGRAVVHFHGELCLVLTGIALVPALFAGAVGDWDFAARSLAVSAILAATWWVSARRRAPHRLQSNEALVIVALGYLLTAALMSWPLAGDGLEFTDAFFNSVSAVTTTGLSTAGSVEARSTAFLFTQAWMQWYGGLVVIVLAVLLLEPGPAAHRLAGTDQDETDLAAGARSRARWALAIYSALTATGFLVLLALGGGAFDALLHTLSAISTGGFSTHEGSLAGLGSRSLAAAVMLISLAGAIPLARYRALAAQPLPGRSHLRRFLDTETLTLLALCAAVALALTAVASLRGATPWRETLWTAPLLAISAQSTAGFTPVDVGALDDSSKLILMFAMFVGGGLGSTAGGIKVMRLLMLARLVQLFVLRPALPQHAVVRAQIDGHPLQETGLRQAFGVVSVFAGVILASWAAFLLYGAPPLDALFEVVSATGTVGLSTGIAAPGLAPVLKLVLCLDMWMGRLEILAVLVLLHPRTWIGRRMERQ
jgi:trk system potassium uptake protein TrkH